MDEENELQTDHQNDENCHPTPESHIPPTVCNCVQFLLIILDDKISETFRFFLM